MVRAAAGVLLGAWAGSGARGARSARLLAPSAGSRVLLAALAAALSPAARPTSSPLPCPAHHPPTTHHPHHQADHLADLEADGVHIWHFEQHELEAVYIPGGCPHDVRNLRPCIKVRRGGGAGWCAGRAAGARCWGLGKLGAVEQGAGRHRPAPTTLHAAPTHPSHAACLPTPTPRTRHAPTAQVAVDFVSPESVPQCLDMAARLRRLPQDVAEEPRERFYCEKLQGALIAMQVRRLGGWRPGGAAGGWWGHGGVG